MALPRRNSQRPRRRDATRRRQAEAGAPGRHRRRRARVPTTNRAMATQANSRAHAVLCLSRAWAQPHHPCASRQPAAPPGRGASAGTAGSAGAGRWAPHTIAPPGQASPAADSACSPAGRAGGPHTAEAPAGADASGPQSAACRAGAPPLHCSAGCSAARRSRTPRPRRSARDTGPHRHRPGPPSRGPDSAPPAG
jgi:hypothetical protein